MSDKKKVRKARKPRTVREATLAPYGATVSATEFKSKCLELIDRVQQTQEEITVTRYGKPVAKLVPLSGEPHGFVGSMKGTVLWYGDIISPTGEVWDAESDE